MKDKLVKSGHSRHYYAFRRFAKGLFLTASLAIVASVPVLVAYGVSVTQTMAETNQEEKPENPEVAVSSYVEAN